MREIQASTITDTVERLCIEANEHLPKDVKDAIRNCRACETWDIAKGVLDQIIENFEIADEQKALFSNIRRGLNSFVTDNKKALKELKAQEEIVSERLERERAYLKKFSA